MQNLSMPDDKTKRGEPDRSRVNIHEPYEMHYWSEKFQVSEERLRQAVRKVGTSVKEVAKELGR